MPLRPKTYRPAPPLGWPPPYLFGTYPSVKQMAVYYLSRFLWRFLHAYYAVYWKIYRNPWGF